MIEHRAFLFQFDQFERELLPILQAALAAGDCTDLVAFIRQNIGELADPYEGRPLGEDWEKMIESPDCASIRRLRSDKIL